MIIVTILGIAATFFGTSAVGIVAKKIIPTLKDFFMGDPNIAKTQIKRELKDTLRAGGVIGQQNEMIAKIQEEKKSSDMRLEDMGDSISVISSSRSPAPVLLSSASAGLGGVSPMIDPDPVTPSVARTSASAGVSDTTRDELKIKLKIIIEGTYPQWVALEKLSSREPIASRRQAMVKTLVEQTIVPLLLARPAKISSAEQKRLISSLIASVSTRYRSIYEADTTAGNSVQRTENDPHLRPDRKRKIISESRAQAQESKNAEFDKLVDSVLRELPLTASIRPTPGK
jgi:hypothetical protein